MANSAVWRANSKLAALKLITRTIPELGRLIHYLIEGWEDVVSKLHFSNCSGASCRGTNRKAGNSLFGEWRIEHSICTILLIEAHGAAEDTTKLDIFSEDERAVVLLQSDV